MAAASQLKAVPFQWQWHWKILIFSALLFPALVSLGFWQLDRADQKQKILDQQQRNRALPALHKVPEDESQDLQYRNAALLGELDESRRILLDNRVRHGLPGYEVFELLRIEQSEFRVLVNRGWVPAALDRSVLPELNSPGGERVFRGHFYRTLSGGLQLEDGVQEVTDGPVRLGWITTRRAAKLFGEPVFAWQLRLDVDSPGALETGWASVAVSPEKHVGYAVQWFSMAVVLVILTLYANSNGAQWWRSRRGSSENE